jgi:hypothetical protein
MDGLKAAIKKTRDYANKYGQKLNDDQLYLRLISPKVYKPIKRKNQKKSKGKNKEWQKKLYLAERLIRENFYKMEGIKMVGITGTVAAEAAKKNEDIDLLIITKKEELWWWRLYLRLYVWWKNIPHREFGKKERQNDFCFNLWLDTANLEIPKKKRNLKNATDLIMMKVILDRDSTYQKFLRKNDWVKKYLATGYEERTKNNREVGKKFKSENRSNFFKYFINRILFWGQYLYMWIKVQKKLKYIKRGQAFFHDGE